MNYKTNRQNHDFQIIHFIAGSCHTPDGAYAILCDLLEDRMNAVKHHEASKLREEAKLIRAKRLLTSKDYAERLDGMADIAEINALKDTTNACLAAAHAEIATIQTLMNKIEPHRLYRDLPLAEAHEAAQAEEWKCELIFRAENYLLSQRAIPADQFATMRMHPEFQSAIMPAITQIEQSIVKGDGQTLTAIITGKKDLPLLLSQ